MCEKIDGLSPDVPAENIRRLMEVFPDCVVETVRDDGKIVHAIDFDHLRQSLGGAVMDPDYERYQMLWPGKKNARDMAFSRVRKTLRPDPDESIDFETTQNIFIEGDNLDALKLLQENYLGAVKMIYIDPPYNTGNDFIYKDKFAMDSDDYAEQSGYVDEDGERLVKNPETNGRFHSDWLSMIYPRLLLAKNMLTDDGVIFISIDDNEQANLKKVCDEVFGESNFVVGFSRVTKKGGKSSDATAKNHDFVFMYTKNREMSDLIGIAHNDSGYKYKDKYFDTRGYYKLNQTLDYDSLGYVRSLDYPIEIDGETFYAGGDVNAYNERQAGGHSRADWGWRWRWSKILFDFAFVNDFIKIKKGGIRPRIYTKTYQNVKIEKIGNEYKIVNNERTKPLSTLEFNENIYSNDNAKKVFDTIMGKGIFEYTKPPSLIKKCMELIKGKDYIVLDFFAGSGTTAHAVMDLNAQDGGQWRCISVQLPEATDPKSEAHKAGYTNIAEITKERIRRAGDKIRTDNADKDLSNLDTGFRVFKIDSANEQNIEKHPKDFKQTDIDDYIENIKPDRTPLDLLFGCLLHWGLDLSLPYEIKTLAGCKVYSVCLHNDPDKTPLLMAYFGTVTTDLIRAITEYKPIRVAFQDTSFNNNDALKISTNEIFKTLSPDTQVKVI